jgi:hypothetical protein
MYKKVACVCATAETYAPIFITYTNTMAIVDYETALTRLEKNMLSNEQMVKDQYMAQNSYKYSDDVDLE